MRFIALVALFHFVYWCPTNCSLDDRLRKYIKEVLKQLKTSNPPPVHIHTPICVTTRAVARGVIGGGGFGGGGGGGGVISGKKKCFQVNFELLILSGRFN